MSEIKGICRFDRVLLDTKVSADRIIEIIDTYFRARMGKSGDQFKDYMEQCTPTYIHTLKMFSKMINSSTEWLNMNIPEYFPDEKKLETEINNVVKGPWVE